MKSPSTQGLWKVQAATTRTLMEVVWYNFCDEKKNEKKIKNGLINNTTDRILVLVVVVFLGGKKEILVIVNEKAKRKKNIKLKTKELFFLQ